MDVELTDLFEYVLKSAIEAQFKANEYSAEIAEEKRHETEMLLSNTRSNNSPEDKKVADKPYYPIPNSHFTGLGVNLKVKLEDIQTDVERSQSKIIRHIQARLNEKLPQLRQINAMAKAKRLSRELMKCTPLNKESIHDHTVHYLSLYLHGFEQKLMQRPEVQTANFNEMAVLEEEVFRGIKKRFENGWEDQDEEYLEIWHTVKALSSNSSVFKNIRFSVSDTPEDESMLCDIDMNFDMRTFTWENYGQS